eukprot:CAMPEP_0201506872 /NCGR_PEP_ID=MMETSP0161_2-20130828/705_1 /ASSEMBLY_ACC=CAM_ASM_000251 /TAXON_ID=180227 /ORGANISM="Neoparamoeba aestuarina, Strain SoJaBio B1-5/56/2" /LENGTH=89 /DNA_ID=CAMNT_0047901097 /DNA_START=103 /DNA_END=372 /DNA_ORIENTATION=-
MVGQVSPTSENWQKFEETWWSKLKYAQQMKEEEEEGEGEGGGEGEPSQILKHPGDEQQVLTHAYPSSQSLDLEQTGPPQASVSQQTGSP